MTTVEGALVRIRNYRPPRRYVPVLATLALLMAMYSVGVGQYKSFSNGQVILNVFIDNGFLLVVAVGMTFVILSGGIDLSVGSVVALGGVLAAQQSGHGLLFGLVVGVAAGAGVGLVNGLLIAKVGLQPFIVTLATLLSVRGLALQLSHTQGVVASADSDFQKLGEASFLTIPVAAWMLFGAFAIGALALHYTPWGRQVLAIGGNPDAAQLMGLPVARVRASVYVLSGALAGLAGVVLGSREGSVDTQAGAGWELTAIAAVVVGGTLLTGGVGSVLSTLVGVFLLQLIFNLINFENGKHVISISSYWESVIRGAFLLVVVLLQVRLVKIRGPGAATS